MCSANPGAQGHCPQATVLSRLSLRQGPAVHEKVDLCKYLQTDCQSAITGASKDAFDVWPQGSGSSGRFKTDLETAMEATPFPKVGDWKLSCDVMIWAVPQSGDCLFYMRLLNYNHLVRKMIDNNHITWWISFPKRGRASVQKAMRAHQARHPLAT